jgi:hypothetical protein
MHFLWNKNGLPIIPPSTWHMFPKHKKVVEYPFVTYVIFNANVFVLGIQHYYLQDYDKVIFECIF